MYLFIHEECLATASSQILSYINLICISAAQINFQTKLKMTNVLKICTGDDFFSICPDYLPPRPRRKTFYFSDRKKETEIIVSKLRAIKLICRLYSVQKFKRSWENRKINPVLVSCQFFSSLWDCGDGSFPGKACGPTCATGTSPGCLWVGDGQLALGHMVWRRHKLSDLLMKQQ